MSDIKLIDALTSAFGPSGFEGDVAKVIKQNCTDFICESDAMHNVFARMKNHSGKKPVIMLDAHTDELGFIVQNIKANGLISFVTLGGWVASNVPAHSVFIRTRKGEYVKGITTSKPPHFMSDAERQAKLDIEDIYIDVGANTREEVLNVFGIQVGDPIMPDVTFEYSAKNGTMFGKAFDNRLGCYCIIETMKALVREQNLYVDIVGAFASQEEVGTRGSQVTAQVIKPDLAIVFEGSPADDEYRDANASQCALKHGTQIRHMDSSYISNPEFIEMAKQIGDTAGIPYQCAVRRRGSTNAGKIHLSHKAVPVLVLGIPSRYVHTHYNFCAESDVNATVDMAVAVIKALNEKSYDTIMHKD